MHVGLPRDLIYKSEMRVWIGMHWSRSNTIHALGCSMEVFALAPMYFDDDLAAMHLVADSNALESDQKALQAFGKCMWSFASTFRKHCIGGANYHACHSFDAVALRTKSRYNVALVGAPRAEMHKAALQTDK